MKSIDKDNLIAALEEFKIISDDTYSSKESLDDLTAKIDSVNFAQKTINTKGTKELLQSKVTVTGVASTKIGTAVTTKVGLNVELNDSIENYTFLNIEVAVDSTGAKITGDISTFFVKNLIYNPSDVINGLNYSAFTIKCNLMTNADYAYGIAPFVLTCWFKDSKTLYIDSIALSLTGTQYNNLSIRSIQGVIIESVVVDPVEYINTTQGIEDVPVGNVISAIGNKIPKHYLRYDDTILNIAEYPHLAEYIKENFGSYNHFGGDGINTFCVSDIPVSQELIDITPIMTSATAPAPYVVTASSYRTADGGYNPYKAFDNDNNKVTSGHVWITADGTKTGWIKLDFNKKTAISHFSIQCHTSINSTTTTHMLKDFVLYGSDDDIVYNKIKEFYGETGWVFDEKRIFDLNGSFVYRYYKLEILSNNGYSSFSAIPELRFLNKSTENKYIKYEPTYFMQIQNAGFLSKRETLLWEGEVGTNKSTEVTNTINLSDSVMNYDMIGVYYQYRNSTDGAIRSLYKEIPTEEIKKCIDTGSSSNYKISFIWGYSSVADFTDIQPSSTTKNLVLKQILSYVTKVVGIRYIKNEMIKGTAEQINSTKGLEDTPVGNIINVIGGNVPKHYLVYDNTEYKIADYPYLAQYIKDQFGSYNYFGGDGVNTFCVNDKPRTPYLIDVTPIMTSNTAPAPYVATASSFSSSRLPYMAFNNTNGVGTATLDNIIWASSTGGQSGWLKLDFGKNQKISHFIMMAHATIASTGMPKDFVLYGSKDDIVYDKIKQFSDSTVWANNEKRTYDLNGVFEYRYYKIDILSNMGLAYIMIPELRFLLETKLETKCIKYEPTYFMSIKGLLEENILWQGSSVLKCVNNAFNDVNQDLLMSDSIFNYDEIRFSYSWYRTSDKTTQNYEQKTFIVKDIETNKTLLLNIVHIFLMVCEVAFINENTLRISRTYSKDLTQTTGDAIGLTKIVGVKYKTS